MTLTSSKIPNSPAVNLRDFLSGGLPSFTSSSVPEDLDLLEVPSGLGALAPSLGGCPCAGLVESDWRSSPRLFSTSTDMNNYIICITLAEAGARTNARTKANYSFIKLKSFDGVNKETPFLLCAVI